MLGVLSLRPTKYCTISPQTFSLHNHHNFNTNTNSSEHQFLVNGNGNGNGKGCSGASPIWRVTVPAAAGGGDWRRDCLRHPSPLHKAKGDGSWNVACDARPARWLHHLDLSYLMLGVCLCLAPFDWNNVNVNVVLSDSQIPNSTLPAAASASPSAEAEPQNGALLQQHTNSSSNSHYRVTGVLADGRCLFRAIAHGVCLQSGEEVPDENRQRELADDLRAQVVEELLKRRKDIEWFIEGDFDAYVTRIQQPYVWGGEPELLMASHVLKKLISVFVKDRSTGELTNIATYGEEYKSEERPINVLFHGYGHYELLETSFN